MKGNDISDHRVQSSSASRFTAGAAGFFILSQSGERPEALADDALQSKLAGMAVDDIAAEFEVLRG